MAQIQYVHVRHSNGAEDMVPVSTAAAREAAGQLTIVDPTPGRYRKISAPALAEAGSPKRSPKPKTADLVVTDSAADAASTAEEATK